MNRSSILENFLKKWDRTFVWAFLFLFLYGITTYFNWKRYQGNPSSMVGFGLEFVLQNQADTPLDAVVIKGEEENLGAGYDGQIFYYFSRTITRLDWKWPVGFDETYRAPRIAYPLLVAPFGWFGMWGTIFGMYAVNLGLFILSFMLLRDLLGKDYQHLSLIYLLSPFSLGSYSVLVSDSVLVSLTILAYYFFVHSKYLSFVIFASLAILTKEQSLFLFFGLGLVNLYQKKWKVSFVVLCTLLLPLSWHILLRWMFPDWVSTRLADFIVPLEGIITYFQTLVQKDMGDWKELARSLSRFPLFVLFLVGLVLPFVGDKSKGVPFRIAIFLSMMVVGTASYYHFWSVYENLSRMFTITVPLVLLLWKEDENNSVKLYSALVLLILVFFLVKVIWITKPLEYLIWGAIAFWTKGLSIFLG